MPPTVERVVAEGRAAWPELDVDGAAFGAFVATHVPPEEGEGEAYLAAVNASDLYLAYACASGSREAARALDRTVLSRIPEFLAHMKQDAAFVADTRQAVSERLLLGTPPRIAEYSGRGPLAG